MVFCYIKPHTLEIKVSRLSANVLSHFSRVVTPLDTHSFTTAYDVSESYELTEHIVGYKALLHNLDEPNRGLDEYDVLLRALQSVFRVYIQ